MTRFIWDGGDLWIKGISYDDPQNPHIYTGIKCDSRLKGDRLAYYKQLIIDALNLMDELNLD